MAFHLIQTNPTLFDFMNLLKTIRHVPVKLYNLETLSYYNRILANGGTISDASLSAVEKFVQDCKNALIWDKLIEVGPFAGNNLNAALVKLINAPGAPGTLTNVNFVSGDYTESGANGGLLGDGATKYLNTGFNNQTMLPDNSHLSFYLREDVSASGNRALLGVISGTDQYWLGAVTNTQVNARLGQVATATYAQNMSKGFYLASRQAANQLKLYKNGDVLASDGTTVTHLKPNFSTYLFGFDTTGTAGAFLPARGSFYSIGNALSDDEAAILHNAVRTLQRNLNRAIN
jgi:hypothetical protein